MDKSLQHLTCLVQLVARTRQEYVDMAKALSRPTKLRHGSPVLPKLRSLLESGRAKSALFDIDSYVRSYESLMAAAWDDFGLSTGGVSESKRPLKTGSADAAAGRLHNIIVRPR